MQLSDRELRGRAVIGSDGRVIGKVIGITINPDALGLGALQIELRRAIEDELGVAHRIFHTAKIDVPFSRVQSIADTVLLAIPVDELGVALPEAVPQPAPA